MTREEAIAELDYLLDCAKNLQGPQMFVEFKPVKALEIALTALRPVSREQVEKVWRGEWKMEEAQEFRCSVCGAKITYYGHPDKFCADCGSAMTDEAVKMVLERLEALHAEN